MVAEADSEADALRAAVSNVLRDLCPTRAVLASIAKDTGLVGRLRDLSRDLGWTGMAAPEAAGGGNMGFMSLAVVYEELGRKIAPLPFLPTQLAIAALGASRPDDPRLAQLVDGRLAGTVTLPLDGGLPVLASDNRVTTLTGIIPWLMHDGEAALAIFFAEDRSRDLKLLAVASDRFVLTSVQTHDHTRKAGSARFDAIAIGDDEVLASGNEARRIRDALLDHAALAMAADALGGITTVIERTVEYLKTRQQFGRPIGSFQALKHRCASMKIGLEASRALLRHALDAGSSGGKIASAAASLAKARICDSYVAIAADSIQLHGGIGFTWEEPCHLFLKRAKFNQLMFGSSEFHLDRAATLHLEMAA